MIELVNHINKQLPFAISLTGDKDKARDLLQDLAVRVYSNLYLFEGKPENEIGRMLTVMVRRINISKWRIRRRYSMVELKGSMQSVENDAWNRIQKYELQKALLSLAGPQQKLCFRLRLDGYSTKDISEVTGMGINNINRAIMQSKKHIIKKLAA